MKTIGAIQALRAFAALSVVVIHFDNVRLMLTHRANAPSALYQMASGVDLFFVISGFVMVYSSGSLFGTPDARSQFLTRRIARIVPLYWLALTIACFWPNHHYWRDVLYSFLFIPSHNAPINGVGWTLNYEMFFYVVFALFIPLRRSIAVPGVCCALFVMALAGHIFTPQNSALMAWSDPMILEFVFGMIVAELLHSGVKLPSALRLSMLLGAQAAIWLSQLYRNDDYRALQWGLPAAFMVAAAVLGAQREDRGQVADFVSTIGDGSYSIYLIHPIVGAFFVLYAHYLFKGLPLVPILGCGMILVVSLSLLTFRFIERPATTAMRRWIDSRRFLNRRPLAEGLSPESRKSALTLQFGFAVWRCIICSSCANIFTPIQAWFVCYVERRPVKRHPAWLRKLRMGTPSE